MPFYTDLEGRLSKLRLSKTDSLIAVFEAVKNSFDAIEQTGKGTRVVVRVTRDQSAPVMKARGEQVGRHPLLGFVVEDDGPGFDKVSVNFFQRSDTTAKKSRGGKGVGRLMWLLVFADGATIESVFEEDHKRQRRTFDFSLKGDGIHSQSCQETKESSQTRVMLKKPHADRIRFLDLEPEALAHRLIDHFFVYLLSKPDIKFSVVDEASGSTIDLLKEFDSENLHRCKSIPFEVKGQQFVLHHRYAKYKAESGTLTLCADKRGVSAVDIAKIVPDWAGVSAPAGENYRAYLTGQFLDDIVDDERTSFRFSPEGSDLIPGDISRSDLLTAVKQLIEEEHVTQLKSVKEAKAARLETFISQTAPQFRPFASNAKAYLESLPPDATERDFELALYKAKMDGRSELNELANIISRESEPHAQVKSLQSDLIQKFATDVNKHNVSALAELICTRRAVLEVLTSSLGRQDTGEKYYEKVLHDLFLPRSFTSEKASVGPNTPGLTRMDNLWLLDERLVFCDLVTSDLRAGQQSPLPSDIANEPDLILFNGVHLVAEKPSMPWIALIEFKRPGETKYTDINRNPVQQLIETAQCLRLGRFEDRKGRKRDDLKNLPIFGYAVCDLTEPMQNLCRFTYGMKPCYGEQGWIYANANESIFIEVISYSRLINDAERRNAAFFKQLGL